MPPTCGKTERPRELYYKFDIAADADYLDVPLKNIKDAQLTDDTIQAVGIASITYGTGSAYTSNGIVEFIKQLLAHLPNRMRIIVRADSGYL